ncbi:hypothetical protein FQZ97_1081790 [compost metagenome]
MLDRAAFRLLRPGHFLTHFPEHLRLRHTFGNRRILNDVVLKRFRQDGFKCRAGIVFRARR